MNCKNCGAELLGDGHWLVYHCPDADDILGVDPDAGPIYCTTDYNEAQED